MDTSITRIEPLYALYPQHVFSKSDSDGHFIDERTLCMLYGVRIEHCLVVRTEDFGREDKQDLIERAGKLIPLKPLYNGKYKETLVEALTSRVRAGIAEKLGVVPEATSQLPGGSQ